MIVGRKYNSEHPVLYPSWAKAGILCSSRLISAHLGWPCGQEVQVSVVNVHLDPFGYLGSRAFGVIYSSGIVPV